MAQGKIILIAFILALAVYGAVALGQQTYRGYIIPSIKTEDESIKNFEKAVREAIDDIAKRLDKGGL